MDICNLVSDLIHPFGWDAGVTTNLSMFRNGARTVQPRVEPPRQSHVETFACSNQNLYSVDTAKVLASFAWRRGECDWKVATTTPQYEWAYLIPLTMPRNNYQACPLLFPRVVGPELQQTEDWQTRMLVWTNGSCIGVGRRGRTRAPPCLEELRDGECRAQLSQ
jgi:hypothetical protein